jgi:hypothetical protein
MWVTLAGLALDFVGVLLLAFDLIRLQRDLRTGAANDLKALRDFDEETGGIADWMKRTEAEARRHQSRLTWDDFKESDTLNSQVQDIANSVSGIGEYITKVTHFQIDRARTEDLRAKRTYWVSLWGLAFVVLGFALQGVGVIIQSF